MIGYARHGDNNNNGDVMKESDDISMVSRGEERWSVPKELLPTVDELFAFAGETRDERTVYLCFRLSASTTWAPFDLAPDMRFVRASIILPNQ